MRLLLSLLLSIPLLARSQGAFEKITLVDDKVSILIPSDWAYMSEQLWSVKYPERPMPMMVLTDNDGLIDLIADLTKQPATEAQIADFKEFQIQQLKNARPDLQFISDGINMVNGHQVGYFKFYSQAGRERAFNFYFFTICQGHVLLFTFNCPKAARRAWEKSADMIMSSLTVTE